MTAALFARLILPIALAAVPPSPSSEGGSPPTSASIGAKLDDLLEQLGSKRFKVRQEAERQLSVREDAAPALRRLLASPNQDLRLRASRILEALVRRANRLARENLEMLAKNGDIDQVIERLVRRPDWGTEEDAAWQVLAAFAGRLLDVDKTKFHTPEIEKRPVVEKPGIPPPKIPPGYRERPPEEWLSNFPFRDYLRYKKHVKPISIARGRVTLPRNGCFVIRGEEVSLDKAATNNLIACTGSVSCSQRLLHSSGIFAGGSVAFKRIGGSVIVCDGEFKAEFAGGCIIIARGPVTITEGLGECLIVSGDKITIPKWLRDEKSARISRVALRENQAVPLGFIKFFDPAQAGITVATAGKELAIKEVAAGKRFARAGLRPGDVLLAVDGTAVGSPESFRRLLRRKLAEGKDAAFKVRRADKTLEIRVPCKD